MLHNKVGIWDRIISARANYPDKSRWWLDKYARMRSKIDGWERIYIDETVLLLVNEQLRTTRSPGKIQAIRDWKNENNGYEPHRSQISGEDIVREGINY